MFCRRKRSYSGLHVCITGGSEGLGFALAKLFVDENADVSIIARTASKLEAARTALKERAENGNQNRRVVDVVGDCSRLDSVEAAIRKAEEQLGPVQVLIANAGVSAPGRFLETDVADYESQMQLNYLGTVYTIKSVVENMVKKRDGEIIIISSAVGVLGMTGYSAYAPTKWALRGFADCLRMEMQAYNVSVRIAYPPNIQTAGYERELERTPPEVKDIVEAAGDGVFSSQQVAESILKGESFHSLSPFRERVVGMKQNRYHLPSPDTLQTLSQASMAGLSPSSYFLPFQAMISAICAFLFAYFVRKFDAITTRHARQRDKHTLH